MVIFSGGPIDGVTADGLAHWPEQIKLSLPIRFDGGGEVTYLLDGKMYRFGGWDDGSNMPTWEEAMLCPDESC